MPPTRTLPPRALPPSKIVKTERTHEENQERAYIAASRRSDRSLEARVESARRASEIHKRRTGRALRVTEQDVINEEMYEEEDDDLPAQYRRLTAHLQTNSGEFNSRLAAYLNTQVAMRNAVEQMARNQHFNTQGNMYFSQQPRANMFQSPPTMTPTQEVPPKVNYTQPVPVPPSPGMMASYRHAPYPSPHQPALRQPHNRSYSTAVVPTTNIETPPTPMSMTLDHRRMSVPAVLPPQIDTANLRPDPDYSRQTQSAQLPQTTFNPYLPDSNPFTNTLPPESQQMLAGNTGFMNDFSSSILGGSHQYVQSPYYPWGDMTHPGMKAIPMHNGAYQTLAPSALTSQGDAMSNTSVLDMPFLNGSGNMEAYQYPNHITMPLKGDLSPSSMPSGQVTPGDSFFNNYVQDSSWHDDTVISAS